MRSLHALHGLVRRGLELARARLHRAQPPRRLAARRLALERRDLEQQRSLGRAAAARELGERLLERSGGERVGRAPAKTARWCRCAAEPSRH